MRVINKEKFVFRMLLFAAFFFLTTAHAQWQLQTTYINSKIGTGGLNVLTAKSSSNQMFGVGLRVNFYSLAHKDDQNNTYSKRVYPLSFYQHFGVAAYYSYRLFPQLNQVRVELFTDVQATYASKRNRTFLPYVILPNGLVLYSEDVQFYGPFLWLENTVGLSLVLPIYKNLSLINKYGLGVMSIMGDKFNSKQGTASLAGTWYEWEATYTVQLGLCYTFKSK